ncbi:single-stranded-DNA-specific exonuclease RecJ [Calidifontibacillus oryziterrae]|uniref:single-stranded-DNA-specific exonuclease RecJ n=1 Tax=Calidifontibacillus oryziterrae TaxID=1191699 RepID=UPI000310D397|nr:single-stranded-DNA-specific exonuclease RecJ [Calidifontibacillus oryziterrae]
MLQSKTRWVIKECTEDKVQALTKELGISVLVARLLVIRGIDTIDQARCFLNKSEAGFYDPFLLDSMDNVVDRIEKAIENDEKILVFGDYDADGVTSTTVMLRALEEKGANVDFYIPNRFTEGYGPNEAAFRSAKNEGFSLIITVDTGISAFHEAKVARELGLDLIITDHHEVSPDLPDAYAIIHPRKPGSNYPFGELAGVGVALKVAHAILGRLPTHLLEFAAIGTVADLVPLIDENRVIASLGVKAIQNSKNPGLRSLLKQAGLQDKRIDEETIGFAIGPRLNAAGRLGSADPAVELLLSNSIEEADLIASGIEAMNRERQQLVTRITEEAIKEVEQHFLENDQKVLVIAKEGWNPGVIGIVASKLVNKYYRPTIVLSIDSEKGVAKGSARSIDGFDLFEHLSSCRDILPHFGGHAMAAGMTLSIEDVTVLRDRLNKLASGILSDDDFIPVTNVDLKCTVADISIETIERMIELAPFGVGNPKPIICIENVSLKQIRKIGSQMNHLKIIFEQDGSSLDSVGFGCGYLYDEISPLSRLSIIGELSINEWNGFRKPQFMLYDATVEEWQLFDLRGNKDVKKQLEQLDPNSVVFIAFRTETMIRLKLEDWNDRIHVIHDVVNMKFEGLSRYKFIVLLDLPYERVTFKKLLKDTTPERIYAVLDYNENHFFSTLPTREHFKWYYAFLLKQQPFDVKKYADALSSKKGWTKETIHFMTQVFFELEFVKIENGVISLVENPGKREFSASKTYRQKQELLQMEAELIYSSYQTLKDWFDKAIGTSRKYEEEFVR